MVPMAAQEGYGFNHKQLGIYRQALALVDSLPNDSAQQLSLGGGQEIRCHELARAVGRRLQLPYQDGYFHRREHSWLWVGRDVLDVYVPGSLPQVQLHTYANYSLPWLTVYRFTEGVERSDIEEGIIRNLISWWEKHLPGVPG
jgi:hypothetical protein